MEEFDEFENYDEDLLRDIAKGQRNIIFELLKIRDDKLGYLLKFRKNLIILLFGDDYAERISPDQLTDDKLLEAVRMLKEVY